MDEVTLTAMAYHEAGHAVIGKYLDFPIKIVTLIPDSKTLGHAAFHWPAAPNDLNDPFQRVMFEDAAVTAFAGPLAEERYLGSRHGLSSMGDYEDAFLYLQRFESDERIWNAWAAYLQERARFFVCRHCRAWNEIKAVAQLLLERTTLSAAHIDAICKSVEDDEEILRRFDEEGRLEDA